MNEVPSAPKRVCLGKRDLDMMSKEELQQRWMEQDAYIDAVLAGPTGIDGNRQQYEAARRENVLVMRLTTKEQEMQEIVSQIEELKRGQNPNTSHLKTMMLDPAVNLMFQRMKKETDICREKLEQAQNDLAAWKFTPDGQTGKRLMAKCRMLLQENEELGKVIASGRTAKLEGEIALTKKFVEEMKSSQAETDEFLVEMDDEVEGMQSTIYLLQMQLKEAKDQITQLLQENQELKNKTVLGQQQQQHPSEQAGQSENDNSQQLNQQHFPSTTGSNLDTYMSSKADDVQVDSTTSSGNSSSNIVPVSQSHEGTRPIEPSWTGEMATTYIEPIRVEPVGMINEVKDESMDTSESSSCTNEQRPQPAQQEVVNTTSTTTLANSNSDNTIQLKEENNTNSSSPTIHHSPNSTVQDVNNTSHTNLTLVTEGPTSLSPTRTNDSSLSNNKDTVDTLKRDAGTPTKEEPFQNGLISSQYDSQCEN